MSQSSTTSINNVTIYYEQHGKPKDSGYPVLVMIHGYLSSTFSFRKLIPRLEEEYSIYALDLPGFGQSEKSLSFVYSMENYGQVIVNFIKSLGLQNVVLVGHSMGGQICLQAVKQAPELIDRLILLNASGYLGPVRKGLIYASYLPFFSFVLRKYFEKKDVHDTIHQVVYDHSHVDPDMIKGYRDPINNQDFFRSLSRLIRHREGDLSSEDLKSIQHPILLIWGREDSIVPLSVGKKMESDLISAKLKVYDQTGHLVPEERALEVAFDITDFIKKAK